MANALTYNAVIKRNEEITSALNDAKLEELTNTFNQCPWDPTGWVLLPYDDSAPGTNQLYVCDSTACWNCGASCTWTVPAGANRAMFQLWGSGSPTPTGCCCGGSANGANGGYLVAVMDVTPGDSWTLCAACACCCFPQRGMGTMITCGSFACNTTNATQCLCACGACGGNLRHMCMLHGNNCCRFRGEGQSTTASGACLCNSGSDWCFASSCATCGVVPYIKDCNTGYSAAGLGSEDCYCGLPSLFGETCFDTNHYGYKIRVPVIGEDHTEALPSQGSQCCQTYTSGTCCGGCQCSARNGYFQAFGGGGTMTHVMGGGNSNCGDIGRPGLVKVRWWTV